MTCQKISFGTGPPSIARSRRFGARLSLGGGLHGKRRPRIGWAVRARPCSHAAATSAGAGGRRPRNGGGMRVVDGRLSVRETREASRADAFYLLYFFNDTCLLFLARSFHRAPPFVPRPLFVHSSCKPWVEVGMEAPRTSSSRASRSARRIAATVARRNGPATSHLRADS